MATGRVAGLVSGLVFSLCLTSVATETCAAEKSRAAKVKPAGKARSKRPPPPAPPRAPAPAAQTPLVELEETRAPPPPSACKVALRTETVASERVRTGLVSVRWTIPPQRREKTELRFQQQTTELDLGNCYRQYLAEKGATNLKPK